MGVIDVPPVYQIPFGGLGHIIPWGKVDVFGYNTGDLCCVSASTGLGTLD